MSIKRTNKEEDLSFSFFYKNHDRIQEIEHDIVDNNMLAVNTYIVEDKIKYLKKALVAVEELKKFCHKSTGGKIYLEDTWEHCHNSKNPDFDYLKNIENDYNDIVMNMDRYIDAEIKGRKIAAFEEIAEKEIINTLKNNPNILQKNIYSLFDGDYKHIIRSKLYELQQNDIILREKAGNTYILNVNGVFKNPYEQKK